VSATFAKGSLYSNQFSGVVSCAFLGKTAFAVRRLGVWSIVYTPAGQVNGMPQDAPASAITVTYDRSGGSSVLNLVSGQLFVARAKYLIPASGPVNNCNLVTGNTAAVTPTHAWMCIVDASTMNIVAISADQTTRAMSFDQPYTFPLTSTWTTEVLIGVMVVAGTMPNLEAASMRPGAMSAVLPALGGATLTGQTTPPTVGTSVGSIAAASNLPYLWLT